MYEALKFLLENDALRVSYSQFSYDFVRQQFSVEKASEKLKLLYKEVAGISKAKPVEQIFVNE
jgi:hypothetical protein